MISRPKRLGYLIAAALFVPALAYANGASETFTRTSLLLILVITLADVCGFLFERLGMPELLGEISAGIILGNLALIGIDLDVSSLLRESEFMAYSSELALVLLLFLVGLESDMRSLLTVGRNALAVAVAGVVLPVTLGIAACAALGWLPPQWVLPPSCWVRTDWCKHRGQRSFWEPRSSTMCWVSCCWPCWPAWW